jgi:hypothetical protein
MAPVFLLVAVQAGRDFCVLPLDGSYSFKIAARCAAWDQHSGAQEALRCHHCSNDGVTVAAAAAAAAAAAFFSCNSHEL